MADALRLVAGPGRGCTSWPTCCRASPSPSTTSPRRATASSSTLPAYPPFLEPDPRHRPAARRRAGRGDRDRARLGLRRARRAPRQAWPGAVPGCGSCATRRTRPAGCSTAPSSSGSPSWPPSTISSSSATRSTPSSSTPATSTCRSRRSAPDVAARTITVTSASKAFNLAGLRWAILHAGHDGFHEAIAALPAHYLGAPNLLAVEATDAAWSEGDEWLAAVRGVLDDNRRPPGRAAGAPPAGRRVPPAGGDLPGVARLPRARPRRRPGGDVPPARRRAGRRSPLRRRSATGSSVSTSPPARRAGGIVEHGPSA